MSFNIVSYGDYRAIELSPLETQNTRQVFTLFLKPHFPDLFVINKEKVYQPIVADAHPKQTAVAIEIIERRNHYFEKY